MTLLTPSPTPRLPPTTYTTSHLLLTTLTPALTSSLYLASLLRTLLSTTTLFLLLKIHFLSAVLLQQSRNILAISSWALAICLRGAWEVWRQGWKRSEWMRKKLFFEFMVFVLGGGNGLFLVVFWPGWIVLALGSLGVWKICG